jgi:serine/threonine-protein kinase
MGNVYRAEHALLAKPVALKVMDTSLLSNADARQRFLREGQAAAAIKHPNVVDITDVGVFEGTPYLVMELLEGVDLQIHLERRPPLSEREVATLLIPIAAALGAAHDRGVVHRDLKPSNIFLSRGVDGEVVPKILDFGISKIAEAVTSDDFESTPFNQLIGSPLYLPPEAVRGSRDITAKSDQYSLGVVLYECVTGRPPFSGDSLLSILNSIAAGDFVAPSRLRPDIPIALERVILRAMNPDPALRFDHVRDLGRELLDIAGMRTQMLWARTFGRIDLSEPPEGPRTSSPVALLHVPSSAPARKRESRPNARHALIALAALVVILIPGLWSKLAPTARDPAVAAAPLVRPLEPSPPEAFPAQAERVSHASAQAGRDGERTLTDAAPDSPPDVPEPPPGAEPLAARAERASAERLPSVAERPRPKRARAVASVEPRAHRVNVLPEPRPRSTTRAELLPEPYLDDEAGALFPAASARDVAMRAGVLTGANESPILD